MDQYSLTDFDIHLFKEGRHLKLYDKLGSQLTEKDGQHGVIFSVWAPNASYVAVIADFNGWNRGSHPMNPRHDGSGIWELFIPDVQKGAHYKYFIRSNYNNYEVEKADPYGFWCEEPPKTASRVWDLEYTWNDQEWMNTRIKPTINPSPMSVYEVHLGSWQRVPEDHNRSLTYREMADRLPAYVKELGFTHVEMMPVMEHPFYGSWGYQLTGYFAPSSRYGTPQDFMHLVDAFHREGIGVILDWVPSHFPSDQHGLSYFDGTHLYEHQDPRLGYHPDWKSYIFNFGRNEVKNFLISNALFWLEKYHIDGLRVDAVASMLYLDYSRNEGEWIPNEHGGRENLLTINFLREFNEAVSEFFPGVSTIAEESTAWPMVSRPTYMGGLGFDMKWMMGWMHDTLSYFHKDSIYRKYHQNEITFSIAYAFTENFMLPLSHDEVVYGKGPLIDKMPGDVWQKFANLRAMFAYMYAHPGTKLLFMGGEFGQTSEWRHDYSLDWHLTEYDPNRGIRNVITDLNHFYKDNPAFYEHAFGSEGFEWIDINDSENSVISFVRKGKSDEEDIVVIGNFTPAVRQNYRIGVNKKGIWEEVFNTDNLKYWGSDCLNTQTITTYPVKMHNRQQSVVVTLPPLSVIYLKYKGN